MAPYEPRAENADDPYRPGQIVPLVHGWTVGHDLVILEELSGSKITYKVHILRS